MRVNGRHSPSFAQKENENIFREKKQYSEDRESNGEEYRVYFQDVIANVLGVVKGLSGLGIKDLINACANQSQWSCKNAKRLEVVRTDFT